jgi:hypothetical protein
MGSFLDRFDFSIDATKMDGTSWAIIGLALLLLAACGLGSIYVQRHRFTPKQRLFWAVVIVCVPLLGLLAYLPASVLREGYSFLKQAKKTGKTSSKM